MARTMSAQEFVNKWRNITGTERATSQSHFIDVCALVGHPTPTENDPHGAMFAFVAGVEKWPNALSDEEILARLLKLNLERAGTT